MDITEVGHGKVTIEASGYPAGTYYYSLILDGKVIDIDTKSLNLYTQQTFQLPADISLEIAGTYNSPSLWGGNFEVEPFGSVNIGLQKKLFQGKGKLKISVSDVFSTTEIFGHSLFGELDLDVHVRWDNRRFNVHFSYLLGNTRVKGAGNRKTGLEEEKKRSAKTN